jgi:CBS domain-containing protein
MSPRAAWRLESLGFTKVFDYAAGKLDWLSVGLPVEGTMANVPNLGSLAHPDSPTCRPDERISDVKARLTADPTSPCVVVNDHRIVLGLLRSDAIQANGSKTVEDVMLKGPVTYRPNAGLEEVDRYLTDHHLGYALVTTSDGELIGLASADDIRRRLT